jgi:hypothetical protein
MRCTYSLIITEKILLKKARQRGLPLIAQRQISYSALKPFMLRAGIRQAHFR